MPPDDSTNSVPESLLSFIEMVSPIFETGRGIRERLLGEGWSPDTAEALAAKTMHFMLDTMLKVMRASKP